MSLTTYGDDRGLEALPDSRSLLPAAVRKPSYCRSAPKRGKGSRTKSLRPREVPLHLKHKGLRHQASVPGPSIFDALQSPSPHRPKGKGPKDPRDRTPSPVLGLRDVPVPSRHRRVRSRGPLRLDTGSLGSPLSSPSPSTENGSRTTLNVT